MTKSVVEREKSNTALESQTNRHTYKQTYIQTNKQTETKRDTELFSHQLCECAEIDGLKLKRDNRCAIKAHLDGVKAHLFALALVKTCNETRERKAIINRREKERNYVTLSPVTRTNGTADVPAPLRFAV